MPWRQLRSLRARCKSHNNQILHRQSASQQKRRANSGDSDRPLLVSGEYIETRNTRSALKSEKDEESGNNSR